MDNKKRSILYVAFCALLFSFFAICLVGKFTLANRETDAVESSDISRQWKNEFNVNVDIKTYGFPSGKNEATFLHTINYTDAGRQLYIRSNYAAYKVYLNDELLSDYSSELAYKGEIPAPNTKIINLSGTKPNDVVKLTLFRSDYILGSGITKILLGNYNEIENSFFKDNIIDFVLCIVLIFGGVVLFLLHLTFHKILQKTHGLLYIGWFTICLGIAIMFTNSIFLSFSGEVQQHWIVSNITVVFSIIPLLLYLIESTRKTAITYILRISSGTLMSVIFLVIIAKLLSLISDSVLLTIVHIVSVTFALLLMVLALINLIIDKKGKKHNSVFFAFTATLVCTSIFDMFAAAILSFRITIVAALLMAFTISTANIREVFKMLEIGMKAKLIGKLAYTDGLTGVGNTTAFREKLDLLEVTKVNYNSIGIIQFDINNLKSVNDNLGHSYGDELIVNGANLIKKAFGPVGDVYRIGGDEFAVITTLPNAASLCEKASYIFENAIADFNASKKHKFEMQIAYGVAFYENDIMGKDLFLRDIQKDADVRMYTMKRKMKSEHSTAVREEEKTSTPDVTTTF